MGYGVTHYAAHGRDGSRMVMQILTPRRYERKLMETVRNLDEKAFIIAYEPRAIHGGFWTKGVRTRKVKAYEVEEIESVVNMTMKFKVNENETISECLTRMREEAICQLNELKTYIH